MNYDLRALCGQMFIDPRAYDHGLFYFEMSLITQLIRPFAKPGPH